MPDVRRHQDVDVAVIGGGPAGAAAATLLARWGHSVTVLTKMPSPGASLGESLPPSIVKPLAAVGLRKVVEAAGFYRSRGNTVWWGEGDGRSESFPSGARGYQVVREGLTSFSWVMPRRPARRFVEGPSSGTSTSRVRRGV